MRPLPFGVMDSRSTFVSDISTDERAAVESGFAHCGYRVIRLQLPTGERIKLFAPATKMTSGHERPRPLEQVGLAFLTLIVKDLAGTLALLAPKGIVLVRLLTSYVPVSLSPWSTTRTGTSSNSFNMPTLEPIAATHILPLLPKPSDCSSWGETGRRN